MTLILRCSPRPKITDDRKINTNYTPIILDAPVCNTSSSFLIQQVTPLTERLSRWSPSPPQHIKTTFQDPINAHRSISPVQFLPHLPLSSACSHTGILNLAKWHMKKVKTETECKNGSQHSRCIPNARLTFEYSLKAFLTQLFTAKSKYTKKKKTSKAFIENPGMQCLRCVVEREHRKPFLQFFFVFFRQSCTVTALSSNMHLVVLSHRCVQTIWSVRKPPGLTPNRKGQWICPSSGFRVKSVSVLGVDRFSRLLPSPAPPCLVQHMFQSTKSSNRFCW